MPPPPEIRVKVKAGLGLWLEGDGGLRGLLCERFVRDSTAYNMEQIDP